ncbi:argininosuccinate synthase domain-containing protein [Actinosynnema sp. NPDC053489]|uniref:argininosuccinate synthase domain-containing protein n=1 Tax=Actinosynnema sp. NPDC053489 TaxID=3363916 RepID=UPI0037C963C8
MSERVVLAHRGGLDPAPLIGALTAGGARVVTVAVDLGDSGEDPATTRARALAGGAVEAVVVDARDEFADRYCLPALRANALRPVAALTRSLFAEHLVRVARRHGATAVAHGRTGADRARFEAAVNALAPDLDVIAPPVGPTPTARPEPPGGAPDWTAEPRDPEELVVTFDRGRPVAVDGETMTVRQAVQELNLRSGARGVRRPKGVHAYQAPGAAALVTAHRELEDLTLEPDLADFKRQVERRWAALVHGGQWFSPLRRALDGFIDNTQLHVSGEVRLVLHGGRTVVTGRRGEESPFDSTPGCAPPRRLPSKIAAT